MEAIVGLQPGTRYRCGACGNLTRFDVDTVERVRRYWHVDLSGAGRIEEEERADVTVLRVTCRWCTATDAVEVVDAPGAPSARSPRDSAEDARVKEVAPS